MLIHFIKRKKKNHGTKHYTEITISLYDQFVFTLLHNTIYCRKRRISRCFTVYVFFYYYNVMGNFASRCPHLRRKHNGICIANSLRYTRNRFFISLSFFVGRRYSQTTEFTYLYQWERTLFSVLSPYLSKKLHTLNNFSLIN